jgi:hypothetical protein
MGDRRVVASYLERGRLVNQYRGLSQCRFCGQSNGSAELTDGLYCWPEGLAHYVNEHEVRLPDEFTAHVHAHVHLLDDAPRPAFDHQGQRDRTWSDPPNPLEDYECDYCEVNEGWWLQQDRA